MKSSKMFKLSAVAAAFALSSAATPALADSIEDLLDEMRPASFFVDDITIYVPDMNGAEDEVIEIDVGFVNAANIIDNDNEIVADIKFEADGGSINIENAAPAAQGADTVLQSIAATAIGAYNGSDAAIEMNVAQNAAGYIATISELGGDSFDGGAIVAYNPNTSAYNLVSNEANITADVDFDADMGEFEEGGFFSGFFNDGVYNVSGDINLANVAVAATAIGAYNAAGITVNTDSAVAAAVGAVNP
jgi:hypothetical protein